jgi:hypothetical protein
MTQATRPLASLALWSAASVSARDASLEAVLDASPGAVLRADRVGRHALAVLAIDGHEWVLVPGGRFRSGLGPAEVLHIERALHLGEGELGAAHYRPWFERVLAAAGACEEATVAPFLVSRRPVAAREVPAAIRRRLAQAWQRQLAEHLPFEDLWGQPAPALVSAALLADVLGSLDDGGRLLDDREWEYLARQGGRGTWVAAPIDTREHDLGLRGLGAPAWVEGGTGARGGGWDTWPWQDRTESLHTVAGARPDPAIDGHGRFVWRARSLTLAVAPEGAPAQLDIERPADPGPELAELLRDLASDEPVPWRRALGRLHKRMASGDPVLGGIVAELLWLLDGAAIREDAVRRARIAAFAAEVAARWTEADREAQRERCREPLAALGDDAVPEVAAAAHRIAAVLGQGAPRR